MGQYEQPPGKAQTHLASPLTGERLVVDGEFRVTADGTQRYRCVDGIVELLSGDLLDETARHEIDSFAANPVIGTCYFRRGLFAEASSYLRQSLAAFSGELRFAEFGGGEGYLARHIAEDFNSSAVYVCDISRRHLELAPETLRRVCCDVRFPVFQQGALDAGAFWVSLHHFSREDAQRCLSHAYSALRGGGVLMLFEPNRMFFPRQILMKLSFLRRKVYFDEEEKHLCFRDCLQMAREIGFTEISRRFVNPPYSWPFVRKLRAGAMFFVPAEALHLCDRIGLSAAVKALLRAAGWEGCWGLYFLTLLRKPR